MGNPARGYAVVALCVVGAQQCLFYLRGFKLAEKPGDLWAVMKGAQGFPVTVADRG